jgi:hypothetical protein
MGAGAAEDKRRKATPTWPPRHPHDLRPARTGTPSTGGARVRAAAHRRYRRDRHGHRGGTRRNSVLPSGAVAVAAVVRQQVRPIRRVRAGRPPAHRWPPLALAAAQQPGHGHAAVPRLGPQGSRRDPRRSRQPAPSAPANQVSPAPTPRSSSPCPAPAPSGPRRCWPRSATAEPGSPTPSRSPASPASPLPPERRADTTP